MSEAVRHGGGGRLVDDSEDVETRIVAGFFGGLALSIIEVSGDGDDSLRDWHVYVIFGLILQLLEDHGADLLGMELLLSILYGYHGLAALAFLDLEGPELYVILDDLVVIVEIAADETLGVKNGVGGVFCGLILGG